jgi:hypothetical protein
MRNAATSKERTKRLVATPHIARPEGQAFFELSRLMVVAIKASNSQLVFRAQTKPNGPWEADWAPVDTTQTYGVMTAGITGDGRVAVVGRSVGSNTVLYIDEAADAVNVQRWNKPVDLGKPQNAILTWLSMAVDAGGRLEIFGTDANNGIWWKYQNPDRIVQKTIQVTPPGTQNPITVTVDEIAPPLTPWSDWIQLPGGLSQIRAQRLADGRLILFGINPAGNLYRSEQKVAQALQPGDWTGWVQMDDNVTGTFWNMASILDRAGAANLFALSKGGQVLHARQSPPCCPTWAPWSTPGLIREGVQSFAVAISGNDDLLLAATDGSKWHNAKRQLDVETQEWSAWIPFSGTDYPTALALDYNADGRLTYFSHWLLAPPSFGGLWCVSQIAFDSTEWELAWTQLAPGDIRQYAVVRDVTPPTG